MQYNCPVHESWNIVHIGSLLPESHAIYVCGDNCLRGVVMTAAEMGLTSRFSAVMPTEAEIRDGRLEEVTIRGTADLIRKLPYRPRAVLLFLVCMHHMVGADENYIFRTLEREFPDICFLRCWMDPAMQKLGPSPDMKLRREMLSPLKAGKQPKETERAKHENFVVLVSDNLPLPEDSTLAQLLRALGIPFRQPQDCSSFSEYQFLGRAALFLTRSPAACFGLRKFTAEEKKEGMYLPVKLGYEDIREILGQLLEKLLRCGLLSQQTKAPAEAVTEEQTEFASAAKVGFTEDIQAWLADFCRREEDACEAAFAALPDFLYRTEISLDGVGLLQPLSAARLLLEHGLPVKRIYLDAVLPEEKRDLEWLKEHAPEVEILSVSDIRAFNRARSAATKQEHGNAADGAETAFAEENIRLALGPVAAFYEDTAYFVNQIENRGAWGYQAIWQLLRDMTEACTEEKSAEELVQRKGWGLPSLVEPLPGGSHGFAERSALIGTSRKG